MQGLERVSTLRPRRLLAMKHVNIITLRYSAGGFCRRSVYDCNTNNLDIHLKHAYSSVQVGWRTSFVTGSSARDKPKSPLQTLTVFSLVHPPNPHPQQHLPAFPSQGKSSVITVQVTQVHAIASGHGDGFRPAAIRPRWKFSHGLLSARQFLQHPPFP